MKIPWKTMTFHALKSGVSDYAQVAIRSVLQQKTLISETVRAREKLTKLLDHPRKKTY